jgi:Arc/MetJ-type ribon-helix-helix transcriptional regulator
MIYQFPPDLVDEVKKRMATGRYSSEDDVLRDAMRALNWHDAEVAAIQQGIDDMEASRMRPLAQFDREFRAKKNIPQDL